VADAPSGQRLVGFLDAAHGVFAPFVGVGWCCERLVVKAPRGRQRFHGLAAFTATTRESFPVQHLTYIPSETVCAGLRLLAGAHPGVLRTIVRDQARSPRCALVPRLAQRRGIALRFLPASAPHRNLLERCWNFVKKQCLYSKYSAAHLAFQQAILACMAQAPDTHQEELASVLPWKGQSFKVGQVIGEESHVSLFPVMRQKPSKVSSKAA